ncbi:MAG: hypothetical protein H7A23_15465 [Leptospiraceae bacterium]|nr:hypothetical protein [Leptospiraceae bacterium]MCP5495949.1 hypothetical protein [Leptospiraceae bacterium]
MIKHISNQAKYYRLPACKVTAKTAVILLGLFINCFLNPNEKMNQIASDRSITDKEAVLKIAKFVWGKTLKNIEIVENKETKGLQLIVEYGGASALTFLDQENYSDVLKLEMAKYIFRMSRYGANRNLHSIRCSIVKPLFVKDEMWQEESVEEFEIFRVSIDTNSLKGIKNWSLENPFLETRQDLPTPEILEVLKEIIKKWKVELDEFYRIKVK